MVQKVYIFLFKIVKPWYFDNVAIVTPVTNATNIECISCNNSSRLNMFKERDLDEQSVFIIFFCTKQASPYFKTGYSAQENSYKNVLF